MQNISRIMKDAPITQNEAVVYWTEYVIKHKGAPYLRTTAVDMPLYEYLLSDVILFVSVMLSAFVYFSFWCCKKLHNRKIKSKNCTNYNSKNKSRTLKK